MSLNKKEISKYDIVYVKERENAQGSVQMFARPAVILQNNVGNQFSPTTIVSFITSKVKREDLPTHVVLDNYNLSKKSMVMLEQVTTISQLDIVSKIDELRTPDRIKVDAAMLVSLGFIDTGRK